MRFGGFGEGEALADVGMDRAGLQGAEEEAGAAGEAVRIRNEMEQGGPGHDQ